MRGSISTNLDIESYAELPANQVAFLRVFAFTEGEPEPLWHYEGSIYHSITINSSSSQHDSIHQLSPLYTLINYHYLSSTSIHHSITIVYMDNGAIMVPSLGSELQFAGHSRTYGTSWDQRYRSWSHTTSHRLELSNNMG